MGRCVMAVVSPSERVYYYECSSGRFRLTYFIPPGELKRLCEDGHVSPRVLEDYPDGVDLGCTEPDFRVFEETYHYRPKQDPDALRHAFFAILSATRKWKKFRGSGFIPAADLERHTESVDTALPIRKPIQVDIAPPGDRLSLKRRRQMGLRQAARKKQTYRALEELQIQGIDPKRTLAQQKFSPIRMAEGTAAEEVFVRLHQRQHKREVDHDGSRG